MSKKSEKNRKKHQMRRIKNDTHLKELAAVKLFRESTKRILDAFGVPNLFNFLPKKDVLSYYRDRFGTLRLVPQEGKKISHRVFREMCLYISSNLKNCKIPLGKSEVTIEDYLTAGLSLYYFARSVIDERPEISSQVEEVLKKIQENIFNIEKAEMIVEIKYTVELIYSRINGTLYHIDCEIFSDVINRKHKQSVLFIVHPVKGVTKEVTLDGKSRPAYRAGHPRMLGGIMWQTLTGRELSMSISDPDKPMDVYIQSHAFIRFRERIDTLDHSFLHISLSYSLQNKNIIVHPNGSRLLIYTYDRIKLGYFPLVVVDGVVVLKTFLFITNTGTPEGDRLDSELKIGILEKQFVGIDKLSTFINSDIMKDKRVKSIFDKVGLGHLDGLDLKKFDFLLAEKKGVAADVLKYMNIGKEEYGM